jgi:hypothetical protein
MYIVSDVKQDCNSKLSRPAQNLMRASLGSSRIAARTAISASNAAAAVLLDAEIVAELVGDKAAEHALDALGAAVLAHAAALEGLKRQLDQVEPKTKSLNSTVTAPAMAAE